MSMGNQAWHRLCNEWRFNKYNDVLMDYLASIGEEYDEFRFISGYSLDYNTEVAKVARKYCKQFGVWLEDACEEDMYIDGMPFGGYQGDYRALKCELAKSRKKRNIKYA